MAVTVARRRRDARLGVQASFPLPSGYGALGGEPVVWLVGSENATLMGRRGVVC